MARTDGMNTDRMAETAPNESGLRILAFCCQFCAYAAADLAGGLRMQYPEEVRIVEIPCSGRMDPLLALQALEDGVDGVMVAGCMPGDCHFLEGNYNARRRVTYLQGILKEVGLEPDRVQMFNMSASMAGQFVAAVNTMCERIRALGPNPLRAAPQPPKAPLETDESGGTR